MTAHAKRQRERRRAARDAGMCSDLCGTKLLPGSRFRLCKVCREKGRIAAAKYLRSPKGRRTHLLCERRRRRKYRSKGLCVFHGNERPCLECSQERTDKLMKREGRVSSKTCTRCNGAHRKDSFLCPMRFAVDVTEFATRREEWV